MSENISPAGGSTRLLSTGACAGWHCTTNSHCLCGCCQIFLIRRPPSPVICHTLPGVIDDPKTEAITTPLPNTDYEAAMAALKAGPTPKLLVFDCDWTLYPYDCDKDRVAPFRRSPLGGIYDAYHRPSDPYISVSSIFGAIADSGIPVAFLSRNPSAGQLKNLLSVIPCLSKNTQAKRLWDTIPSNDYFHAYSTGGYGKGKDRHFAAIHAVSTISFSDMLFFDDMPDNIAAATNQGTTSVLLTNKKGLTLQAFLCGINGWRAGNTPLSATGG